MSDRRGATRVLIPERPTAALCVLQDVVLESASPTQLVILAVTPIPRGVDLVVHVEHEDGGPESLRARTTGRRPVLVDARIRHRVSLAVLAPSSRADATERVRDGRGMVGPVPAAIGRRIEVRLEDISATGCLLQSLTPIDLGTDVSLDVGHGGESYSDSLQVCWSTAVAGGATHRVGGRFVPLTPPSRRSVRRLAGSLCALLTMLVALGIPAVAHAQSSLPDVRARATAGWTAVEAGRFGEALKVFAAAAREHDADPGLAMGAGAASFMLGRNAEATSWLERALRLNPRYVDASILLGEIYYGAGRVQDAIAAYEVAAAHEPGRPVVEQRLRAWRKEAHLLSGFHQANDSHFLVFFEGPADAGVARRALEMLETAYARVGATLQAYPADPITVVLYTGQQFRDIAQFPPWAAAAYDGRIRVPALGAGQSLDQLEAALSHEFTHAVVSGLGGRAVPAWLHEGLATVLEPGGAADAAEVLSRTAERIELSSLRQSFSDLPPEIVQLAYAQSAQSVRRLLAMVGPSGVVALLRDMANGAGFDEAFERRAGVPFSTFETIALRS